MDAQVKTTIVTVGLEQYMKIKRISLPDEVCSRLRDSINSGTWGPCEKIPSESSLSKQYGVNRLTIRMALQKLNTLGIVETRVGEGTFVKKFDFDEHIREISDLYMHPELLDNVCEFRKLLEVECARLAMKRATEEELQNLGSICERIEYYGGMVDRGESAFSELLEADLEFHQEIVRLSKNELYEYSFSVAKNSIIQYLTAIIKQRIMSAEQKGQSLSAGIDLHRQIYQAIVEKDVRACKKALNAMIDYNVEL